jgi:hypothetical protein
MADGKRMFRVSQYGNTGLGLRRREETRLLGKTARRNAVTKLSALPPVMAKCTLLKRDRPSTSGSTVIK